MPAHTGLLRAARAEVIPRVPALAAEFVRIHEPEDMTMIRDAIVDAVADRGVDPATIQPADLNKTERSTIAGFAISRMVPLLVEGEGRSTRFIHEAEAKAMFPYLEFSHKGVSLPYKAGEYDDVLFYLLSKSAAQVEHTYAKGKTPETMWFGRAVGRYSMLGSQMATLAGQRSVTREGGDLRHGLRSRALDNGVTGLADLVLKGMPNGTPAEKMAAAHDLSYLVPMLAAMNLRSFLNNTNQYRIGLAYLNMDITKHPKTGAYALFRKSKGEGSKQLSNWEEVFSREGAIAATLKCPAHAEIDGYDTTSLERIVPAAVNLLPAYRRLLFHPYDL